MAKLIKEGKARRIASRPKSSSGPSLYCRSKTGAKEYLVVPVPKTDQYTLWEKIEKGYIERAVSESPNDFEELIDWTA